VAGRREKNYEQDILGIETKIHVREKEEAPHQQSGAD
jgi:hypothetical protein